MAGKINMEFEEMKSLAKKFDSFDKNIQGMNKDMGRIVTSTIDGGKWQGETAKSFKDEYLKMKDSFTKFAQLCASTYKSVNGTADSFRQADQDAAKRMKS